MQSCLARQCTSLRQHILCRRRQPCAASPHTYSAAASCTVTKDWLIAATSMSARLNNMILCYKRHRGAMSTDRTWTMPIAPAAGSACPMRALAAVRRTGDLPPVNTAVAAPTSIGSPVQSNKQSLCAGLDKVQLCNHKEQTAVLLRSIMDQQQRQQQQQQHTPSGVPVPCTSSAATSAAATPASSRAPRMTCTRGACVLQRLLSMLESYC